MRLGLVAGREVVADREGTANAAAKFTALVAGKVRASRGRRSGSEADSISDMNLLRHGGVGRVFDQVRAPSTLGTFLHRFTSGQVRQLDAVAARALTGPARAVPLLPGADRVTKQGAPGAWLHRGEGVERAARGAVHPERRGR